MAQKIPFFDMFADLLPPPELKIRLCGASLTGATLDQKLQSIELRLLTRAPLPPGDVEDLQRMIGAVYGFSAVKIEAASQAPAPMCCSKLSKTHIEQLRKLGAFAGMANTSQMTLF